MHEYFKKHVMMNDDIIIELSAGNGAFIDAIKEVKNNMFLDIESEHSDIITKDFLTFNTDIKSKFNKVHIINPPFGRNHYSNKIHKTCMFI